MRLEDAGLRAQPFCSNGRPSKYVKYRSQLDALKFLHNTLTDERGVGLLYGPDSSGKSTLITRFVEGLPSHLAVAVVDGAGIKTSQLLSAILAQFGYQVALHSTDELLSLLNVLVVQQARSYQAPVLILKNTDKMHPDALRALCKLAGLTIQNRFALRIILVSKRNIYPILEVPGMRSIAERLIGEFELGPLTARETLVYLYAKLQACGVAIPDGVLPLDVCDALHHESEGWPGLLDEMASCAIEGADRLPIRPEDIEHPADREAAVCSVDSLTAEVETRDELPKLLVTLNGKTLQETYFADTKLLIGRSFLSDVVIDDPFASKHHALLIRSHGDIFLVDLKSRNGTLVNSRRVRSIALRHSDVISIGHHSMKIIDPKNRAKSVSKDINEADTAAMNSVDDMRRIVAEKELYVATANGSK